MTDISIYFQPVDLSELNFRDQTVGSHIVCFSEEGNFPDYKDEGVAIIHAPEYRRGVEKSISNEFLFREKLYHLFLGTKWDKSIYDFGTIIPGSSIDDTYHAIRTVCVELIKKNILPVIVGGTQDITIPLYQSYEYLEQMVNITTIDSHFDIGEEKESVTSDSWFLPILTSKPCYLFNYSNIGLQGHYCPPKEMELIENLYFDFQRLGEVTENITCVEPTLRNTDLLSFDLKAIRNSDMNGDNYIQPNGLFHHEACRVMRYAGISDKLSSIVIANYFPDNFCNSQHEAIAQYIWYFIDGYMNRKGDFPVASKKKYISYKVQLIEQNEEITFYKSNVSDRWWMEVPYPVNEFAKYQRHYLVPCTYQDYQESMKGDLPNLWWKTYQKLI